MYINVRWYSKLQFEYSYIYVICMCILCKFMSFYMYRRLLWYGNVSSLLWLCWYLYQYMWRMLGKLYWFIYWSYRNCMSVLFGILLNSML